MHHFPCQSLLANKVWAIITAFAYTSMRAVAPALNTKIMHYAKRIRFRMIYLGAHVVKKSRYWIIRLNNHHYEEVNQFQCRLTYLLSTWVDTRGSKTPTSIFDNLSKIYQLLAIPPNGDAPRGPRSQRTGGPKLGDKCI